MSSGRRFVKTLLAGFAAAAIALPLMAQTDFGFMPDGGRQMIAELFKETPDTVKEMTSAKRTEVEWQDWLKDRAAGLSAKEKETLASYLALNMPLAADAAARIGPEADIVGLLPPDGKDLAIANCQYCHSLFTGYLVQRRKTAAWQNTFKSPFHKELHMNERERDTFARYSAINMPLRIEDVPEELRF